MIRLPSHAPGQARPRSIRSPLRWAVAIVLAAHLAAEGARAQQPPPPPPGKTRFSGTTSLYQEFRDKTPLSLDEAFYEPLPNVQVNAFGPRAYVSATSAIDPTIKPLAARYFVDVPVGPPVRLLFYYLPQETKEEYIPTLKSLTAELKKPQHIHVVMLTREQYVRFFSEDALIDEMRHVHKAVRQMIEKGEFNADDKERLRSLERYIREQLLNGKVA